MAELTVGARVWYVPGPEYALLRGIDGRTQYRLHYAEDAPNHHKKHEEVGLADIATRLVRPQGSQDIFVGETHKVYIGAPQTRWPAWVVGVNPDGTVDLDIASGRYFVSEEAALACPREKVPIMYHIPDRHYVCQDPSHPGFGTKIHAGAPGIPHDPQGKRPHSFHAMEA